MDGLQLAIYGPPIFRSSIITWDKQLFLVKLIINLGKVELHSDTLLVDTNISVLLKLIIYDTVTSDGHQTTRVIDLGYYCHSIQHFLSHF